MKKFLAIFCVMLSAIIVHGLLSKPEGTDTLVKETIDLLIRKQNVDVLKNNIQAFVDAERRRMGVPQGSRFWTTLYPLGRGTNTTARPTSTPSSPPLPSTVAETTLSPTTAIPIYFPPVLDFCKRFWTGWWCKRRSFDSMSNLEKIRNLQRKLDENAV